MTLRLVDEALPSADELEGVVGELLEPFELLRPRRRWTVEGMRGAAARPALDPFLDSAPPPSHTPEPSPGSWLSFFDATDHEFVRRQIAASLERVIFLDEVRTPDPCETRVRLSEPLLSRDRSRVLLWINLLQYGAARPEPKLYVMRVGELALERAGDQWTRSPRAPGSCRSWFELEV